MKLLMLKGLPASGKSTYAKELVAKGGWVRTNKDDLRQLLHGGKWSKANEKEVIAVRNSIILTTLADGRNVVVDDTNFAPKHEQELREMAKVLGAEFEIKEFDTDIDTCIERDLKRPNSVGSKVIHRMYRESVAPVRPRIASDKPKAVIFDIDGTLAAMNGRSPYEWDKVGYDTLNVDVRDLLSMFDSTGYKVLIFSGRDSVCKEETAKWLDRNRIYYNEFHMRAEGDTRKDVIVKREFYDDCSQRYDIRYAVDDRLQVCRMWHELGVCLLRVGDPEASF